MKTILLCGQDKQEVDCIQVDAILVKLSDGQTLALTENSLRRAGLENLDATDALPDWMHQRVAEFRAATAQSLTAK
jgi:hypothetical protein